MSHALADVVHAEDFRLFAGPEGWPVLGCPACADRPIGEFYILGEMLAAARAHIADAHTAAAPSIADAVLHAVEAVQGDAYPALIPEADMPPHRPVKVCGFTGNTIRGPLYPVEEPGAERVWMCRICFGRYRRSVAHAASPLPIEGDEP